MNLRKGPKDPYLPSLLTIYPYLNDLKERDRVSATKTVNYFKIYF